jgi:putative ABC transport system substrate-binding protein
MRRREILALVCGVALCPCDLRAQQPRTPIVGYLGSENAELFAGRLTAFRAGLKAAGYEEGRNIEVVFRWAEGRNERFPALAADLVQRGVSVIAAPGSTPAALAAKLATSIIPIVFAVGADPVALGLVASLSRPGANVTGATSLNVEVGRKRLELLRDLVPGAAVVGLLVNPTNPALAKAMEKDAQQAATLLGIHVEVLPASSEQEFRPAFEALAGRSAKALVIGNDAFFISQSRRLGALSVQYSVPAIHQSRQFAEAGGLASYGGSVTEAHRQVGLYVGRIVNGERPADLPVVQSSQMDLAINMATAKALGLTIPPSLLARADEVIE